MVGLNITTVFRSGASKLGQPFWLEAAKMFLVWLLILRIATGLQESAVESGGEGDFVLEDVHGHCLPWKTGGVLGLSILSFRASFTFN